MKQALQLFAVTDGHETDWVAETSEVAAEIRAKAEGCFCESKEGLNVSIMPYVAACKVTIQDDEENNRTSLWDSFMEQMEPGIVASSVW